MKFLIGLNYEYAVLISNVLAREQVPNIDVVYDMVVQEETRTKSKKGTSNLVLSYIWECWILSK